MRILCWTQTDVGQKRDHNEDSFLVAADVGLYVVADGMGGHAGGDQASQMAVTALHEAVRRARIGEEAASAGMGEEPPALTVLRQGARTAGELIFDLAQQNSHLSGMGTTLTALLFNGGRVHLAHVGDSRAFLFRDGRIEQLSEDHSWINEQVKAGLITDEEARHSKFKHIITRSVGFERDVSVDVMSLPVLMGDCYLICSDGLSNYLDTEELGRLLTAGYYSRVPGLLVDLANERGGDDNITVVLVYVANDSGPPVVEDLSRPDPFRAVTHPGPDPTLSQTNAHEVEMPRGPTPQASPQAAPQAAPPAQAPQAAPPFQAPQTGPQAAPQPAPQAAPQGQASPQAAPPDQAPQHAPQAAPQPAPQAAPPGQAPQDAPPGQAPQAAPQAAPEEQAAPKGQAPQVAAPTPGGVPGEPIDPEADTAPADLAAIVKASQPIPSETAAPEVLAEETTPEAGVPVASKPPDLT